MILQDKNSNNNMKVKYLEGNRVFIGYDEGYLYEYSMNEKRIVYRFGQILNNMIISMATTFDNKYLFLCDSSGGFIEFDIPTRTQVNNFGIKSARYFVVTYDNQFLITADNTLKSNLTKWSIQTKQQLYSWKSIINSLVCS